MDKTLPRTVDDGAGGQVPVDAALALAIAGRLVSARILRELHAAGWSDLRESDGYVFQHLLAGRVTVGELAGRLGVSQQAASKTVADLESRGYVARRPSPEDARIRLVTLTARGRRAVDRSRRLRTAIAAEVTAVAEDAGEERFTAALEAVLAHLGGAEALRDRSLRIPS
jgi:DNA-binding MarR family transcriptional regulator